MALLDYFRDFADCHGKVVKIDGLSYRLRVQIFDAIYPYQHQSISVHAEPVSRKSKYYRKVREELGDDWSLDVLSSSLELQCSVLEQIS